MKKVLVLGFLLLACFLASKIWAAEMVDINTASLEQLDTLTGIGPVYAQRIIDGRPYSSLNDLLRVSGIGEKTLQKIKDQGLVCVNCADAQSTQNSGTPPAEISQSENSGGQESHPAQVYPSGIFINEVLPNPEGPDETDEWIELYNSNSFDIDLSGWKIQDTAGTIKAYTIEAGKILAGGFLVFKRPETKIMLNNDEDKINLLTPDGKTEYSVNYSKAPLGQSYNRNGQNWAWSTVLTPETNNVLSAPTNAGLQNTKKSDNSKDVEAKDLTAGLSQSLEPGANPWPLFFAVLIATIILAAVVLIIKFKLNKNVRT